MIRIYSLFILIIFYSCSQDSLQSKMEKKFPIKEELKYIKIEHNNNLFGDPTNLRLVDSLLFVLDPDSDNFIKIANLNNLTSFRTICPKGRGPGEFGMICRFEILEQRKLCFYDDLNTMYHEINFKDDSLKFTPILKYSMKTERGRILNTIRLNDCFVSTGLFKNQGRIMVSLNNNIDTCKFYNAYPVDDHPKMSNMNKGMAYQTHFSSCKNKYFVGYSLSSGEIMFYTIANGILKNLNKYQLFIPSFEPNTKNGFGVMFLKDSPMGFMDVVLTDKFVYALYSGRVGQADAYMGSKVFVFTHTGIPVKQYSLNIDIRTFDIDSNGDIYGISINPTPQLVKFITNENKI